MSTRYSDDYKVTLPQKTRARLESLLGQTGLNFIVDEVTVEPTKKTGKTLVTCLTVRSVTTGHTFDRPPKPTIRVLGKCTSGGYKGRDFELVIKPDSTQSRLTVYNRE